LINEIFWILLHLNILSKRIRGISSAYDEEGSDEGIPLDGNIKKIGPNILN